MKNSKEKLESMLLTAIQSRNIEDVKKYIDKVDLNRYDQYGYTPLMLAALDGTEEIIKYILKKTSNPFLLNKHNTRDAYYYAIPNDKHIFTDMIPDFLEKREVYQNATKYNL